MASEARSGQGTLRTVALASGGETADNRPSAVRCQPPTAEHSPLGAAVCGSGATTNDGNPQRPAPLSILGALRAILTCGKRLHHSAVPRDLGDGAQQ
jgi:hypothetical protein